VIIACEYASWSVFNTNHEAYKQAFITGDIEEKAVYRKVAPEVPREDAEVIKKTHHNKLGISMISLQNDADKMGYLKRDAYFTG
ncbi:hypothetical protein FE66_14980, partial [Staphylococcus aureus]